jgi:hypothetical protein
MDCKGLSNFKISKSNFFHNALTEIIAMITKKKLIPFLCSMFNTWIQVINATAKKKAPLPG